MVEKTLKLEQKIRNRTASVGVIGLGHTGLPLAVAFVQARRVAVEAPAVLPVPASVENIEVAVVVVIEEYRGADSGRALAEAGFPIYGKISPPVVYAQLAPCPVILFG